MNRLFLLAFFCALFSFNSVLAIEKIIVTSPSFQKNSIIPDKHACDVLGDDKSPPLTFNNIPGNTESLTLILDDPDAPGGTFNHWVIFNIPRADEGLQEDVPKESELENGIRQGINSTSQIGYFGHCPPQKETHRYVFKVFALDTVLDLEGGATKKELIKAMKGHILGRGKLVGRYKNNTNL